MYVSVAFVLKLHLFYVSVLLEGLVFDKFFLSVKLCYFKFALFLHLTILIIFLLHTIFYDNFSSSEIW